MNLLHVTLGYLPAVSWGGPVKIVHQNARELGRRGHQVTVVSSNLLSKQERLAPGTVTRTVETLPVVYLHTYLLPQWPGTTGPTFLAPGALARLWREVGNADLVHVHGTRNMVSLAASVFALWRRKPLVLQPHGTLQHIVASIRFKQLYDFLLLRRLVRRAAAVVASTRSEREQVLAAGGTSGRTYVIPNGRDSRDFARDQYAGRFREKFNIAAERQIVLFLGRVNRKKGTDLLIEAYARLAPSPRRRALLVIAGPDDGQMAEVRALVAQHNLEDEVLITGLLEGDDVTAAFVDADLFVLPCRTDTFPMALLEACEAGTPIVLTDTCEVADLFDDVAATVVPVDPGAIAGAITSLLQDNTLRARYRLGGQALLRHQLSVTAVVDRLEALYREVLP
jgi:glycosyltransferase involved in cell wall biosynthesis